MNITEIVTLGGFIVVYTSFLFGGIAWMLNKHTQGISKEIDHIKEIISRIQADLSNHITDTNKKIEDTRRELVNLRKDTNEQFSRLYELLIQDRKQKQAKQ